MCRFIEGDELNNDPSNWWTFNEEALLSMCRAAGFGRAEVQSQPGKGRLRTSAWLRGSAPYRAVLRASKAADLPTSAAA